MLDSKWIEHPGLRFMPSKKLQELVTRDAARRELGYTTSASCRLNFSSHFSSERKRKNRILDAICGRPQNPASASVRSLFAILTMIGHSALIEEVVEMGITDADLPLVLKHSSDAASSSLCRELPPETNESNNQAHVLKCRNLQDLTTATHELFIQQQRAFLAPVFQLSCNRVPEMKPLILDWRVVLPFVGIEKDDDKDDEQQDSNVGHWFMDVNNPDGHSAASSGTRSGGFGEVRKISIHPDHYNSADFSSSEQTGHHWFALKALKDGTCQEVFDQETTSLKRVMAKQHPNIVCLLGTMERQSTSESQRGQKTSKYYLIFPWADANLEDFITKKHPTTDSPARGAMLVRWLAREILGLATALKLVHLSEDENKDGKTLGRHGDIKPQNILWYHNHGQKEDMGTLKLADFGAAEFHSEHSVNIQSSLAQHSPTHRAPEHDIVDTVSPKVDLWSLGAVLLELVVWYMCGHEGWNAFSYGRSADDDGHRFVSVKLKLDKYFNVDKRRSSVAYVKESVHRRISDLRHHKLCSAYFTQLLDLIEKRMLVVSHNDRISCDELVEKFELLYNDCQASEAFCTELDAPHLQSTPISQNPTVAPLFASNKSSFLSRPSIKNGHDSSVASDHSATDSPPRTPMTSREDTQELNVPGIFSEKSQPLLTKSETLPEEEFRTAVHQGAPKPLQDSSRCLGADPMPRGSGLRNDTDLDQVLPVPPSDVSRKRRWRRIWCLIVDK